MIFSRLKNPLADWKSKENQDRTSSDVAHMHAIEALDNIIRTKQHIEKRLEEYVQYYSKHPNAELYAKLSGISKPIFETLDKWEINYKNPLIQNSGLVIQIL